MSYLNRTHRRHNNVTKLFTFPDRGVNSTYGVGGILSRLFRQMLIDFNVDGNKYSSLLTTYMNDPSNNIPNNRADRASKVGNFNKEFGKPTMSLKKFIEAVKLLQFYGETEIIFKGRSKLTGGEITTHITRFNLGEYEENEEDIDLTDDDPKEVDHE